VIKSLSKKLTSARYHNSLNIFLYIIYNFNAVLDLSLIQQLSFELSGVEVVRVNTSRKSRSDSPASVTNDVRQHGGPVFSLLCCFPPVGLLELLKAFHQPLGSWILF